MNTPKTWKRYEDFAAGIDTNRLPPSPALTGREVRIEAPSGDLHLAFVADGWVSWRLGQISDRDACEVVELAPDLYFVDIVFGARPRDALTLLLNLVTGRTLSVLSRVRSELTPGEPQVEQMFEAGTIAGVAVSGEIPAPSRDLIGLRAFYRYSPNHLYEHTYLSSERYCWQCLEGEQRGHGDVDLATVFRFAPDQYVFAFREFKIPVASVFFINFEDGHSTGKFLGITGDGAVENRKAGAFLRRASRTFYDEAVEPV